MSQLMKIEELTTPCAVWTDDCQGKKDFDGRLLSISTRYYPGPEGGGFMTVSNGPEGLSFGTAPYAARPSAIASIDFNFGIPDAPGGYGNYVHWREEQFEGDTEESVKMQVEGWVRERMGELVVLLGILGEDECIRER